MADLAEEVVPLVQLFHINISLLYCPYPAGMTLGTANIEPAFIETTADDHYSTVYTLKSWASFSLIINIRGEAREESSARVSHLRRIYLTTDRLESLPNLLVHFLISATLAWYSSEDSSMLLSVDK